MLDLTSGLGSQNGSRRRPSERSSVCHRAWQAWQAWLGHPAAGRSSVAYGVWRTGQAESGCRCGPLVVSCQPPVALLTGGYFGPHKLVWRLPRRHTAANQPLPCAGRVLARLSTCISPNGMAALDVLPLACDMGCVPNHRREEKATQTITY